MHLHVLLDCGQWHLERIYDVALPHRPVGDQLTGEQPETSQVLFVVLKYRPVEIDDLSLLLLEGNLAI
jgi:hypothetical protein